MIDWQLVYEWVVQLSLILVALVSSGPIVYNWVDSITGRLGWHDWKARAVVGVVSFLLGAAGLVAQGLLTPDMVQPANAAMLFISIWGASQAHYSKMKREEARIEAAVAEWKHAEGKED
jgi:multidrug efflux pump subunit AcrB